MTTAHDLWHALDRIRDLPTLPAVALEVNRLLEDADSPVEAISSLIEKDQALTARILKLVNSSFFGLQSQVASIRRAMVLLGSNQVRNAVYALTVLEAVGRTGEEIRRMWQHGAAVAAAAQHMALALKAPRTIRENAFTAGLLHDIGKLIIWCHFPEILAGAAVCTTCSGDTIQLLDTPDSAVGHAEVGAYMARRWRLPEILQDAIRHHHRPSAVQVDGMLAALVHVADLVVHQIDPTAGAVPLDMPDPALSDDLRAWLTAPDDRLAEVAAQIEAAGHFFNQE